MQVTLADIQKDTTLLTKLSEPLHIMDEQRKQIIATVYPRIITENARRLAGKTLISAELKQVSFEDAREVAMLAAMREKYGISH